MDEIKVYVNIWAQNRPLMLRWMDPISGKYKTKSSGVSDWAEAERLAGELEKQLRAGASVVPSKITWKQFRARYQDEKLDGMKPGTQEAYRMALNHVDRVIDPDRLCKITTSAITTFVSRLRKEGMKASTRNRHLRHIKAALRWAHRHGYLGIVPNMEMAKTATNMKGRPIAGEEFDRMLDKVVTVRPNDATAWRRLLDGLWLSGLRISEAVALDWRGGLFQIDLDGKHPCYRIQPGGQKSGKAELCPCTPDFVEWLLANTPEGERAGRVFPLPHRGRPHEASTVVSAIGDAAGIVVDATTGKTASAHDLRRSFGSRWARRVMPAVLQRLMRHSHIATTMNYYVDLDVDEISADLWTAHRNSEAICNSSCNSERDSSDEGKGGMRVSACQGKVYRSGQGRA